MKIINGDSLEVLKTLEANSVDSIVTDPPYGLSFMGKKWDYDVPSKELWVEAMRVLKPGGHLLSFAGSRTYHRMAVNIEDAGFEIRDQIMWVYGSGFPKSHNIGKAVDKLGGEEGIGIRNEIAELITQSGKSDKELADVCGVSSALVRFWRLGERNIQTSEAIRLRDIIGSFVPEEREREVVGERRQRANSDNSQIKMNSSVSDIEIITKGTSPYEGWGTALKPAHEPIVVARKPLSESTIAENVLKWGTGGINIDGCRVETDEVITNHSRGSESSVSKGKYGDSSQQETHQTTGQQQGRFPANFIHDGSDEVVGLFPDSSTTGKRKKEHKKTAGVSTNFSMGNPLAEYTDSGSASRFFYCAKASKKDRNEGLEGFEVKQTVGGGGGIGDYKDDVNSMSGKYGSEKAPSANNHPTVKPTSLMQYLVRLVTPTGGTVLDPFTGSGSTGKACVLEGFDFIGIELDPEYCKIAEARININDQRPI